VGLVVLGSITARTKRDHWVPGLPRHRWHTVHQHVGRGGVEYNWRAGADDKE